ncbi:hypothetical protein K440DRAFT_642892 [Wilcoxina mikolae CBS 423.85]|nr:hypothetical protein K440DRAFT_642892 [Wilcoxina mikolae CBS 423.85]
MDRWKRGTIGGKRNWDVMLRGGDYIAQTAGEQVARQDFHRATGKRVSDTGELYGPVFPRVSNFQRKLPQSILGARGIKSRPKLEDKCHEDSIGGGECALKIITARLVRTGMRWISAAYEVVCGKEGMWVAGQGPRSTTPLFIQGGLADRGKNFRRSQVGNVDKACFGVLGGNERGWFPEPNGFRIQVSSSATKRDRIEEGAGPAL